MIKRLTLILVLSLSTGFGLMQASRVGYTTDEGIHVASAYLALQRGEFRFDPEHPFLFKYLTALPLLALNLRPPANDAYLWQTAAPTFFDSWREARTWADNWFYSSENPTESMIFLSRIPGVLIFTLLLYLLFRLTMAFSDNWLASILTILVAAFTPTFLGHAPTTNTDIPLATATTFVLLRMYLYGEKPTIVNAWWSGLALLLAVTTKFSGAILLIPSAFWFILVARKQKMKIAEWTSHLFISLFTIWLGIWLFYGFHSQYVPLPPGGEQDTFTFVRQRLAEYHVVPESLQPLRLLLPVAYLKGLILTTVGSSLGRGAYLLSIRQTYGGYFWYFPVLFILKTQFAFLCALWVGLFLQRNKLIKPTQWSSAVQMLVLFAFSILLVLLKSKLNIGFRHASALLPIVCIAIGFSLNYLYQVRKVWAVTLVILAVIPLFLQKGDYISYANAPLRGDSSWQLFDDSNLDWGQETKLAAKYIALHFPDKKVYYNPWRSLEALQYYLGSPVYDYDQLHLPQDGIILVTASQRANREYSKEIQQLEPIATIGNGIAFLYTLE